MGFAGNITNEEHKNYLDNVIGAVENSCLLTAKTEAFFQGSHNTNCIREDADLKSERAIIIHLKIHSMIYEQSDTHSEKMSPVYIYQNDKLMTSLALLTAHQVNTNICQPHSLKGCHNYMYKLVKNLSSPVSIFATGGNNCQYNIKF